MTEPKPSYCDSCKRLTLHRRYCCGFKCEDCNRDVLFSGRVIYEGDASVVKESSGSALQVQVGGDHYKSQELQPYEIKARTFTSEELWGFCKGSVMDYLARDKSDRREDIEKAIHHLQLYLELSKPEVKTND